MSLRLVLRGLTQIVISAAALLTTYLYLYPAWFGCAFPSATTAANYGFQQTIARHTGYALPQNVAEIAPFRLLVLADPQLEGDSSLPDPEDALASRLVVHAKRLWGTAPAAFVNVLVEVTKELVFEDVPRSVRAARKTLDLFGNDYYLAHIYRTLRWWAVPTHVAVLGDLIGSQWVSDDEFEWRGWRYWNRVFAGSKKVSDEIMNSHNSQTDRQPPYLLQQDGTEDWKNMVINAVGNHDIGYAGDISKSRIERFEHTFGKVNWDVHFSYPDELLPSFHSNASLPVPSLHLVVLNSMLLDTPAIDPSLQSATYDYINDLITHRLDPVEQRNSTFTLLLTHVPLHKPAGTCVDAPFFEFWDFTDADGAFKSGGLKEQNHLSEHASQSGILQAIFGMSGNHDAAAGGRGRNGLILNGHDHEGCDVVHYIERDTKHNLEQTEQPNTNPDGPDSRAAWSWKSNRTESFPPSLPPSDTEIVASIRELTLRSMMGEFGGNAGLLSLWYDFESRTWRHGIQMCPLGVQHIWWAVHVVDILAVLVLLAWAVHHRVAEVRRATTKITTTPAATAGHARSKSEKSATSEDMRTQVDGGTASKAASRLDEMRSCGTSSTVRSTSQRRRKG